MRAIILLAATTSFLSLSAQELPKESHLDFSQVQHHKWQSSNTGKWRFDFGMGFSGAQKDVAIVPFKWGDVFGPQRPIKAPQEFFWPTFFCEVEYRVTPNLSLGIHYDHWQQERWTMGDHAYGNFWNSVNTYMASARWMWSPRGFKPEFYSGAMAGAAFRHFASRVSHGGNSDAFPHGDDTLLAYQFTVIGMRTGGRVGFVLEIGYGFKGIVSTGLSYKF